MARVRLPRFPAGADRMVETLTFERRGGKYQRCRYLYAMGRDVTVICGRLGTMGIGMLLLTRGSGRESVL